MEIKIYYEDTDCGGVVYYANYLKYFERARTEYLAEQGMHPRDLQARGIFFMVATANVKYHAPSRYGEVLVIDTRISGVGQASFTFIYKVTEKKSRRLIVEGETKMVTVDTNQKLKRLEQSLKEQLQKK
ncbi:MAG: acyl-CoA thioesterase [Planctomycetes bacterium]|nr:acyl-CoA thioesterase [Planctomycetota bacterium]